MKFKFTVNESNAIFLHRSRCLFSFLSICLWSSIQNSLRYFGIELEVSVGAQSVDSPVFCHRVRIINTLTLEAICIPQGRNSSDISSSHSVHNRSSRLADVRRA